MKAEQGPRKVSFMGTDDLRRQAEAELAGDCGRGAANGSSLSPEEVSAALHELRTHQIELEMQNEELRRLQIELEMARDRFADLFDFAPIGYVTISAKTGLIVEANLTLAELLGVGRKSLLRRRFTAFIHPPDQDTFYRQRQALRATGTRQVGELRMKRCDGTTFWAEISCVAESDGLRIWAAVSDVTARVEGERARRRLEEQLWQAKKLESLAVLAGGVAHDFNNLLHAVLCHAEIVHERLPASSPLLKSVLAIEEASERAAELAAKMLAYSGKGRFVLQPVDLSALAVEVGRLLEGSIGRQTELIYDLADDLPEVVADVVQIRQMIMNLVLNAAEAIGTADGTIRVETAAGDCDEAYLESTHAPVDLLAGPYVWLTVADTGCGMDEAVREKLFEPFFTTKFSGRGLGMAATLGIVRGHAGAIRVESEPGRGTTIQVLLPASQDPIDDRSIRLALGG